MYGNNHRIWPQSVFIKRINWKGSLKKSLLKISKFQQRHWDHTIKSYFLLKKSDLRTVVKMQNPYLFKIRLKYGKLRLLLQVSPSLQKLGLKESISLLFKISSELEKTIGGRSRNQILEQEGDDLRDFGLLGLLKQEKFWPHFLFDEFWVQQK